MKRIDFESVGFAAALLFVIAMFGALFAGILKEGADMEAHFAHQRAELFAETMQDWSTACQRDTAE